MRQGKTAKDCLLLKSCSIILRLFSRSVLPSVNDFLITQVFVLSMISHQTKIAPKMGLSNNIVLFVFYYFKDFSLETVNFLRPFARRLASTLRPLALCIRLRKPWTDLRRRVCGWNVRFIFFNFKYYQFSIIISVLKRSNLNYTTGHHTHCAVKGTAKVW